MRVQLQEGGQTADDITQCLVGAPAEGEGGREVREGGEGGREGGRRGGGEEGMEKMRPSQ